MQLDGAELQRRQFERQAERAQIEQAMREIGTRRLEEIRRTTEQQAKQSTGAAIAAETESRLRAAMASERLLASSAPVAAAKETARAGDLLVIDIAGEPDLPRVYVVADNGAIRLPLIGDVPVLGLTTAQVREAVIRELTSRQLAGNPVVTVALRRAR
jgi:protein involved in polysaccharide export with SLBB domain